MNTIPGFTTTELTLLGTTREVFRAGSGRAVIVMTEVPGITPEVARFAGWVAEAGFSVWMPQFLGTPLRPISPGYIAQSMARVCISREFRLLASNECSPIVDWMRALARRAHQECGGPGVGAIGMCLTGNFALSMMLDAPVIAPVLAQPSLPALPLPSMKQALHASPEALAAAHEKIEKHGARILGVRFHGDPMCPPERFRRLREEFGDAFEGIELDAKDARPGSMKPAHSALTTHLFDQAGQPTRVALDRTLAFFKAQLQ
jgi:dienelactone hydrolase